MMQMIINVNEQIPNFSRYNGGWIKTVEKLDKDFQNGYSLVGKFLPVGSGNINLHEGELYLDCSIDGSRKNQERNYTLFRIIDKEVFILQTIENGGQDWAMSLWDSIEKELDLIDKERVNFIFKNILELSDDEFGELMFKINKDPKLNRQFMLLDVKRAMNDKEYLDSLEI